jgi:hypothetical protein
MTTWSGTCPRCGCSIRRARKTAMLSDSQVKNINRFARRGRKGMVTYKSAEGSRISPELAARLLRLS